MNQETGQIFFLLQLMMASKARAAAQAAAQAAARAAARAAVAAGRMT